MKTKVVFSKEVVCLIILYANDEILCKISVLKMSSCLLQPPWKNKTVVFTIIHSRKIQECNFPEGKSPCGMLLADPELVSWKILNKPTNYVIIHVQNSQECCFYQGKSSCGTQPAGQGLVKMKSSKSQLQIHCMHFKSNWNMTYSLEIKGLGLEGSWGITKKSRLFLQGL